MAIGHCDLAALIEAFLAGRLDVDMPLRGARKFASLGDLQATLVAELADAAVLEGDDPLSATGSQLKRLSDRARLQRLADEIRGAVTPSYRGLRSVSRRPIRGQFSPSPGAQSSLWGISTTAGARALLTGQNK